MYCEGCFKLIYLFDTENSSSCSSIDSKKAENAEFKSRPRPGSFNTGKSRVPVLLPPPPSSVQRRNSSVTTSSGQRDSLDLISFSSPSPTSKVLPGLDDFEKDGLSANSSNISFKKQTSVYDNHVLFSQKTQSYVSSTSQNSALMKTEGFVSHVSLHPTTSALSLSPQLKPCFSNTSYINSDSASVLNIVRPTISTVNYTAHPFETKQYSSSLSILDKKVQGKSGASFGIKDNGSKLEVLKVIEKRDNSNLIDLPLFDSKTEDKIDKSSARESVLEAFDPLMSSAADQKMPQTAVATQYDDKRGIIILTNNYL